MFFSICLINFIVVLSLLLLITGKLNFSPNCNKHWTSRRICVLLRFINQLLCNSSKERLLEKHCGEIFMWLSSYCVKEEVGMYPQDSLCSSFLISGSILVTIFYGAHEYEMGWIPSSFILLCLEINLFIFFLMLIFSFCHKKFMLFFWKLQNLFSK